MWKSTSSNSPLPDLGAAVLPLRSMLPHGTAVCTGPAAVHLAGPQHVVPSDTYPINISYTATRNNVRYLYLIFPIYTQYVNAVKAIDRTIIYRQRKLSKAMSTERGRATFAPQVVTGLTLLLICVLAFAVRLFSVIKYESVIHEFDPYFNYRVTRFLTEVRFIASRPDLILHFVASRRSF